MLTSWGGLHFQLSYGHCPDDSGEQIKGLTSCQTRLIALVNAMEQLACRFLDESSSGSEEDSVVGPFKIARGHCNSQRPAGDTWWKSKA
jgi:hypothetical protein